MTETTTTRRLVTKAALRVVNIDTLNVDPTYQRELKRKHKKIVAEFNENALGIPLVAERQDGTLWIVDGYQRISAIKVLGHKTVRAEVFSSRGTEHEAEVFKLVNLNRTKLTTGEQFRAMLAAHDKTAWGLKEVVEKCGFRIVTGKSGSKDQAATQLTCISILVRVAKANGLPPIQFALSNIAKAWPGDRIGSHGHMINGLCIFFVRNGGVVDEERLLPRLQTVTPHKILYAANQATLTGDRGAAVADQIERVYRKRNSPRKA